MQVGTLNEKVRTDWLAQALAELPAGARILDAGAGRLKYRRYCSHLNYVSQDFARYDGQGDGRGLHTGDFEQVGLDLICDITAIPEADAAFDAILCVEVLEHLPEPLAALREFARLLRPGGTLLLTAPFCSLTHYAPYHFSSGYNRYYYQQHLPALGFELLDIVPNGNFFEFLAQEIRRLPEISAGYARGGLGRRWLSALSYPLLAVLQTLSRHDQGSHELLCFGYQLRAVRKEMQ